MMDSVDVVVVGVVIDVSIDVIFLVLPFGRNVRVSIYHVYIHNEMSVF